MDHKMDTRVITLKHLWGIFVRRLWLMVLAAVLCMAGLFAYHYLTFTPIYDSTATLYILRQGEGGQSDSADADFSLALKVVNDCTYLLKSHAVVDQVIEDMGLDMTYDQLYRRISTSNPENTRILEVTVEADTPELAKEIADSLCLIGQEKITEAMGFQQVNFYERGILDAEPCNRPSLTVYALVGLAAAMVIYAAFLIAFLADDRIRTEEDIQQYLGLSVLGNIPNCDNSGRYQRGYYAYMQHTTGKAKGKRKR